MFTDPSPSEHMDWILKMNPGMHLPCITAIKILNQTGSCHKV